MERFENGIDFESEVDTGNSVFYTTVEVVWINDPELVSFHM